jgi:uncharacterized protein
MSYLRASVDGGFWGKYRELVREKTIPYQWMALNDEIPGAPRSHSLENFRIAAGRSSGQYEGMVFQDSDLYKWLEAAGHLLQDEAPGNERIRAWTEQATELIAAAQQPDGYINTYFTVKDPAHRWKNLREAHELYCAGHLIEAGVAVARANGNAGSTSAAGGSSRILDVVRRFADHIDSRFGTGSGKLRGYCGHEEVELALVKLARLTGEKRYLGLARYFIEERGKTPNYFEQESKSPDFVPLFGLHDLDYLQARVPPRELTEAAGHAVRAMYLSTAMADIALETGDSDLGLACDRLWESAASRRMYVTGGIGSSARNESFSADFDLPNDTAYAETCAAIGLFIFGNRMANLRHDARYADVMERALFNGVISGLSFDGRSYFYVNPLSVRPQFVDKNPSRQFVKYRRQPWYGCACCPPNIARILASLGEYVYHLGDGVLYADLFHDGSVTVTTGDGPAVFRQRTEYPWSEEVTFEFTADGPVQLDLAVRLPSWCRNPSMKLNGARMDLPRVTEKGYAHVPRQWRRGDRLQLVLPMPAERVRSDPRVEADFGKVAVQRGPLVYCLEEVDSGPFLHSVVLPAGAALEPVHRDDLPEGTVALRARGRAWDGKTPSSGLYWGDGRQPATTPRELVFIPYYAWANRQPGEMTVWVRE